jgi:hypothetical protein
MKTIGYDKPLYILPFDHRGSFETKMFGLAWRFDGSANGGDRVEAFVYG